MIVVNTMEQQGEYMGKTLMITGACGHIGVNMVVEAINRGWKVIGLDSLHRKGVEENLAYLEKTYTKDQFEFKWGDIRNPEDFLELPMVDAICHLAGQCGVPVSLTNVIYDFEVNARGTLNALEFARKCGNIPFVYASTNKTFSDIINEIPVEERADRYVWAKESMRLAKKLQDGVDIDIPNLVVTAINENFPVSGFGKYGHSMYGVSKLTGELYVTEYHTQYGLPTTINKMSCIFGLFQKGAVEQGWISHFTNQIGFGDGQITFFGTGKQVRDVLDARDLAKLYLDEVESLSSDKKCDGEVFIVGGGPENTVSLIEAVAEIEKQTGKKATISYEKARDADQMIYISSLTRVKEVMGWEPTIKLEQTIADMISEYSK